MAGYQALSAAGRSIVDLLNRRIDEELAPQRRPTAVLVSSKDLDEVDQGPDPVIRSPAVSLYCYRLSVDRETRPGWSAVASVDGIPRVPLRMHLLVSAWDEFVADELRWMGLAIRILESESILTGPVLHPDGGWEPADTIQVVPDELGVDSMSEAFQALTTKYRLCLPYVVRVVRIDGRPQPTAEPVTTVLTGAAGS
ncbi:uncharacterized protein DUF4255 [Kribbella orskensis]|uniref:Uncharacterized protein DUF4255 n=1 Tax=Kribbella orskensis TaxID=2512216 RepID=A0ABY2B9X7_9ACTN|nr:MULTISPECIES: DUF4255 domain-containing protein [Kribbella]TCN32768.1 uncharacterized protein DUF4255 [Kribbella sp. VKM Ac-2500]TCO12914.1 uncharacterized protein DUF4255 [Kribbella orskensis]